MFFGYNNNNNTLETKVSESGIELVSPFWKKDPYCFLLEASWPIFFAALILFYLTLNCIFAGVYFWSKGIVGLPEDRFLEYFFFSIQTISTVGYGSMHPNTHLANILVSLELVLGILSSAILTGVFFAKFSRPSAKLIFSNIAVVHNRSGKPSLFIRLANQKSHIVAEAQARVTVMKKEITPEGELMRRLYDLKLLRDNTPNLLLGWTLIHEIDESSPLFGIDAEEMVKENINMFISIIGFDTVYMQTVHARKVYRPSSIKWSAHFQDMITLLPDGRSRLEYGKIDLYRTEENPLS